MSHRFSLARVRAVLIKEFIQVRRDRLTFAMMIGVPLLQLLLFGYAINSDPKQLPTAVVCADPGPFARSIVSALETSAYFEVTHKPASEAEGDQLLALGEVQFLVVIPAGFDRSLQRGERPNLLVAADATDPSATGNALSVISTLGRQSINRELSGPLASLKTNEDPFEVRVQRRYNPEGLTSYNIVPGLMGVILTMTMIMMTALSVTREREKGTMENLLATPARPLEVMVGKVIPYVVIGYVQVGVILIAAKVLFEVPMLGSLALLAGAAGLFIVACLAVGFTFSTLAKSQLQAMQMTMFFFLPNILLSGFMFPFRGMPEWAQYVGSVFPLTHFLRIVRGILLKDNTMYEVLPHVWPILAFVLVVSSLALKRYKMTLD